MIVCSDDDVGRHEFMERKNAAYWTLSISKEVEIPEKKDEGPIKAHQATSSYEQLSKLNSQ